MNALVIARRELAEKKFVLFTAAAISPISLLIALLPSWGGIKRADLIATCAGIAAIGFTLSLAVLLGASMIGRDLSEKRLSFYLAKPLSARAIWFGKVVAAAVLLLGCLGILMLPAYLAASDAWSSNWNVNLGSLTALVLVLALALLVVSHTASTMVRSRSPRIAVDAVLAVAAFALGAVLVRTIFRSDALGLSAAFAIGMVGSVVVALFFAGAWQLERGRADRRRNHIELSKFLWTSTAIVLALGAAFVAWVTGATPHSVRGFVETQPAMSGDWMFVESDAALRPGYRAKFLINANDGSWYRYRPAGRYQLRAAFTADGRHAAYLADTARSSSHLDLYTLTLDGKPEPVDTGLAIGTHSGGLVLSDDGSRLALIEDRNVRVIDLATKRTIGAARLQGDRLQMFFVTNDVLRLYVTEAGGSAAIQHWSMRIFELNTATHSLRETSAAPLVGHTILPLVAPDGATMLVRMHDAMPGSGRLVFADARTGQVDATIPVARRADIYGAALIEGNRAVHISIEPNGHGLLHVSGDPRAIDLGNVGYTHILELVAPDKLLIASSAKVDAPGSSMQSIVVDLARGVVERRDADRGLPLLTFAPADPRVSYAPRAHFIAMRGDRLVRWNALTGETKALF